MVYSNDAKARRQTVIHLHSDNRRHRLLFGRRSQVEAQSSNRPRSVEGADFCRNVILNASFIAYLAAYVGAVFGPFVRPFSGYLAFSLPRAAGVRSRAAIWAWTFVFFGLITAAFFCWWLSKQNVARLRWSATSSSTLPRAITSDRPITVGTISKPESWSVDGDVRFSLDIASQ